VALALLYMHEAAICGAQSFDELNRAMTDSLHRLIDCDQLIKVRTQSFCLETR
jgi:hypothetical protein